ncbi:hypothetical protein CHUAL_008771 [Chamberlinius hualienensis]
MPYKIPFRVYSVTGEDEHHRAKELNAHGPTVHGWQSPKFCTYPQEIVMKLENRCRIFKIQILSHQFLIASQIKISVGDLTDKQQDDDDHHLSAVKYKQLGFVSLSDNERTNFKARELKSIHVDVVGTYIRFVIHKNIPNRYNVCNQVGIVAINVIGDTNITNDDEDEIVTEKNGKHQEKYDLYQNHMVPGMIRRRPEHISPMDDLTFDMYQDPEVAQIIRKLEIKKQQAVSQEKYDYAKKLKAAMTDLWKAGETLGKYEIEKQQAISMEDYEKARRKKSQMEEYRMKVYEQLQIPTLLEMNADLAGNRKQPTKSNGKLKPSQHIPITHVATEFDSSDSSFTDHRESAADESSLESYGVVTPRSTINHQPREGEDVYGKVHESDDTTTTTSSDDHAKRPRINGAGLTSLSQTSKPIINSFVDHGETALPALQRRRSTMDVNNDEPIRRGPRQQDSNLTESDKRQAALPIEIFGLITVQLAYSKLFSDREEALDYVRQQVIEYTSSSDLPPAKVMKAATFLAQKALKDIVISVFSKSLDLLTVLLLKFPVQQKVPRSEINSTLDKIMPELLSKLGDKSVRLRTSAQQYIMELMDYPEVLSLPTVPQHCLQPLSAQMQPRLAQGQTELVEQLVNKLGVNSNSGLTLQSVMTFCVPALQHPTGPVREIAERIIIQLYMIKGREVRKYLPPNDAPTRRNMIYRNLFETIDALDLQNGQRPVDASTATAAVRSKRHNSLAALPTPDLVDRLEKACIFCGAISDEFTSQGLDVHYWKHCPMLIRCSHCKQVVEIAEYIGHLLEECSSKDKYAKCKRCQEAIPKKEFDKHVQMRLCIPAKLDKSYSRCQLCHKNIGSGEKSWKVHLIGKNGCERNPRRKSINKGWGDRTL